MPETRKVKSFYCRKCGTFVEPPLKDYDDAEFEAARSNTVISAVIFHCPGEKCEYLHIVQFEAEPGYRVKLIDAQSK